MIALPSCKLHFLPLGNVQLIKSFWKLGGGCSLNACEPGILGCTHLESSFKHIWATLCVSQQSSFTYFAVWGKQPATCKSWQSCFKAFLTQETTALFRKLKNIWRKPGQLCSCRQRQSPTHPTYLAWKWLG